MPRTHVANRSVLKVQSNLLTKTRRKDPNAFSQLLELNSHAIAQAVRRAGTSKGELNYYLWKRIINTRTTSVPILIEEATRQASRKFRKEKEIRKISGGMLNVASNAFNPEYAARKKEIIKEIEKIVLTYFKHVSVPKSAAKKNKAMFIRHYLQGMPITKSSKRRHRQSGHLTVTTALGVLTQNTRFMRLVKELQEVISSGS